MFLVGVFFFQAEDGIRDLVRSRGLGDVYKRQLVGIARRRDVAVPERSDHERVILAGAVPQIEHHLCLLYTSDAADERSSVDLGGRRIIKKKNKPDTWRDAASITTIIQQAY